MRPRTLIVILAPALVVSVLGSFVFGLGGGFGGRGYGGFGRMVPRSLSLVLVVIPLVVALIVLAYALVFPELGKETPEAKPSLPTVQEGVPVLDAVLRVLNDDEKKVVETLVAEGGTMLQKDIRWKTGLSRVKTHRVLYRLAERGIVSAEKYHNTNKITLANWLTE